jgi:hypothetical protein
VSQSESKKKFVPNKQGSKSLMFKVNASFRSMGIEEARA